MSEYLRYAYNWDTLTCTFTHMHTYNKHSCKMRHTNICKLDCFLFYRSELDVTLPELGKYATGLMFIDPRERDEVQTEFTKMSTQIGLEVCIRERIQCAS